MGLNKPAVRNWQIDSPVCIPAMVLLTFKAGPVDRDLTSHEGCDPASPVRQAQFRTAQLGSVPELRATPVPYSPTLSGSNATVGAHLNGPNPTDHEHLRYKTGIASPVCIDRLPSHISKKVVSTVSRGGP